MLEPGSAIADNLRLSVMLSRGPMSTVWVADHVTLGSQVAVKVLTATRAESPVSAMRFEQEARLAAKLTNPHVVRVSDYGITDDGECYIVMELIDGESLADRLERDGRMSLDDVTRVVRHTAKALDQAHGLEILHRDIKPANIAIVDNDGEVFAKVLDFGVAKMLGEQGLDITSTGAILGTPRFMSPEQFRAEELDARTDLWSLGVVAYQALTGDYPFGGDSLGELELAIRTGEFTPPSAIVDGLPRAIDRWFERALAVDCTARFSSAKQMAVELGHASGTEVSPSWIPQGEPIPIPEATETKRRRWPWWVAATVTAVVTAFVVTRSKPLRRDSPTTLDASAMGPTAQAPAPRPPERSAAPPLAPPSLATQRVRPSPVRAPAAKSQSPPAKSAAAIDDRTEAARKDMGL